MGCVRSKVKSSHCYNCGSRKYPSLNPLPTSSSVRQHYRPSNNPSRDIFSIAHMMSNVENDDIVEDICTTKKLRNNDGTSSIASTGSNVFVAEHKVSRQQRGLALDCDGQYRGCVVWLTGLSGAGKSTVAMGVEKQLISRGYLCYCLDGDNMRAGLNKGLGFSSEDRKENIRRTAEVAVLMADAGFIVLSSLVSPSIEDRTNARSIAESKGLPFFETFVSTPLEECERRDTKGLYRKCRAGEIKGFTGIDQVYEEPRTPDLVLDTVNQSIEETVDCVITFLKEKVLIMKFINQLV